MKTNTFKNRYSFLKFLNPKCLTALVLSLVFFVPNPAIFAADSTQIMNQHGEGMQLEFKLYEPGEAPTLDYTKFGTFLHVGTDQYQYKITDRKGVAAAVGEGVYPNTAVYKDPTYRILVTKGRLSGSQWDYVNIEDQQLAFYKWATSHDTPAVQQFYTALTLERLGEYKQALKAYHAVLVHFPKQVGWTFWHTPLYMGKLSLDRIDHITKKHPELGLKLTGAVFEVENGYNLTNSDDKFKVDPGHFVKASADELNPKRVDVKKLAVKRTLGGDRVQLVQYENGHWQVLVEGKPYMVKAVAYAPTPVGKSPHDGGYDPNNAWMTMDLNQNGKIDGAYDSFLDKNKNNKQDPDEPAVGDFQLFKDMGVNTLRLYHHAANKELLRELYAKYGIRVIMGDMLGMYAAGSGAAWYEGTDYTNPEHLENMRASVRKMVEEHKDEPYVLMWMLGNESNYGEVGDPDPKSNKAGLGSKAKTQPEEHYKFVNEVAGMIKEMDPSRPVGFSNGEVITIDILGKYGNNVDVFGCNVYRGATGFGRSFWEDAKKWMDRPVLLTEFGCPAYFAGKDLDFAEDKQREYHQGNWEDVMANSAGSGVGNAIGGVIFEFVDEWWKTGLPPKFSPSEHDTVGDFVAAFPDGWMHEEWLGLMGQGDGSASPYLRQARQSYEYYKKVWNQK
jgi:hypothetical protein